MNEKKKSMMLGKDLKYCEECQNLVDLCGWHEDCIRDLRASLRRWELGLFLGGIIVLALAGALLFWVSTACGATWPLLAPNGTRQGEVREQPGSQAIDIFDAESNREGWGRRNRDGSIELFDKDSRRTGAVDRGGVLRMYKPRGKGRR